jgi:choline-glycine betaine transporter
MIVTVYSIVIHAAIMKELEAKGAYDKIVSHYIIHILPFLSIFFNVTFSNIKFRYSHVVFTILFTSVFFVVNYYGVIYFNKGEPFYPFFPWTSNF